MTGKESRSRGLYRLEGLTREVTARGESLDEERQRFERLKGAESPRVVVADQLFQTPPEIAGPMAAAAYSYQRNARRVLEPSAGLGRLIAPALSYFSQAEIFAVDIAPGCIQHLETANFDRVSTMQADFLTLTPEGIGSFDVVLMNPPFRRGLDIAHIRHALQFVRPGGVLVGLCYAGQKQARELLPQADQWSQLPAKSFRKSGTDAPVFQVIFAK